MSKGWSPSDKEVAQKIATKAKSNAEAEALRLHREFKIATIEDLWALEQKIQQWRRERRYAFTINYETVEKSIADWLKHEWIGVADIARFSDERKTRIEADAKETK